MKKIITFLFTLISGTIVLYAQNDKKVTVVQGKLIRITPKLKDLKIDPNAPNIIDIQRDKYGLIAERENEVEEKPNTFVDPTGLPKGADPAIQEKYGAESRNNLNSPDLPAHIDLQFDGMGFTGVAPADPTMCVGQNHIIQMINGSSGSYFKVFNKDGTTAVAQTYLDQLPGAGFFGQGDPIALYDQLADRYILTEFGNLTGSGNPTHLLLCISQTNDPTGAWVIYRFETPGVFPDYPHWAIWNNAYYATTNTFAPGFVGCSMYAFDRAKILASDPTATMQSVLQSSFTSSNRSLAPVSLLGTTAPAANSPGLFAYYNDDYLTGAPDVDSVGLFTFLPDFTTPANTVISRVPPMVVAPFKSNVCGSRNCAPGCNGSSGYDVLSNRIMHHVYLRRFPGYDAITIQHTVDAGGGQAATRWYELRNSGGGWSVYQQSTYAPNGNFRFMPSMATNAKGQICLAYNITGSGMCASIGVTGRNASDPLNTMTYDENIATLGTGYGTFGNRWGDYNDMNVDPTSDSTFWFTAMYGQSNWNTRIIKIKLRSLTTNPSVTINQAATQGDPTTGSPINFTVVFSESVSDFATGDVTLSGTAGATTATVTGSGTTYNVAVTGMTSYGTVIATIAAGVATGDVSAMVNTASTSTDNSVTYVACITDPVVINSNDAGPGSLRQAVADACPGSTITFDMNTVVSPIVLTSGEITINKNLTIYGPGASALTISGGNNSRIFFINNAVNSCRISQLNLTGGNGTGATNNGRGGAIYNFGGGLTIDSCSLSNNTNTGGPGGALCTANTGLTSIHKCLFSNNHATTSSGGAISNFSTSSLFVYNSTFTGNTENSSTTGGGAILGNGRVSIYDCTFSNNSSGASRNGGALYINTSGFAPLISHCTITGNTASNGGGIFITPAATAPTIYSSLIADNTTTGTGPDVNGTVFSGDKNLVSRADGSTGFIGPNDILGTIASPVDPMIGPLADNGGLAGITLTHKLLTGSPAIDQGDPGLNPFDERGMPRPVDIPSIPNAGDGSDIGAYEVQCIPPNTTATPDAQTVCSGSAITPIVLTSNVSGASFSWTRDNPGITGIAMSGNGNIMGSLTNNGTATVTVTFTITASANGCSGPSTTATVDVLPTPTVNPIADQTVCNGEMTAPVNFTSPVPGVTYNWTNSNTAIGLAASGTGDIAAFTATNATLVPITGTITVTPQIVLPGAITFTGALLPGDPTLSYRINRNGVASTCASPKTWPGDFGSGPYFYDTYSLTNNTGADQCVTVDYVSSTSNFVHVTAYNGSFNPANQSANYLGDGGNSANTSPVSFSFTAPAGATIVFVVFDPNNTTVPGYTVTVNGLPTTCSGPTESFDITVNPTPTITCPANITVPSPVGACSLPVNYSPTVTGTPAPTLSYVLTGATTGSGAGSGSGSIFNVGVTTVTITATNICDVVSCSFTVTVTDSQLPTVTDQPDDATVCVGSNAVFSVTAVTAPSAGGPIAYQWQSWNGSSWNNMAGETGTSLTLNSVTQAMNTNSYRVRLTGLCSTVYSDFATLYVNPLPTVHLSTSIPPALLPTQVLTITATTIPSGGSYVWYKNGSVIPGAGGNTLPGLTVSDQGTYHVVYTDANGCVMTSSSIEITALPSEKIWVYPVPNPGVFDVRFYNTSNEQVTVRVFDEKGAEVYQRKTLTTIPYTTVHVNINGSGVIANGTYMVEVRGENGRLVGARKIIVNR